MKFRKATVYFFFVLWLAVVVIECSGGLFLTIEWVLESAPKFWSAVLRENPPFLYFYWPSYPCLIAIKNTLTATLPAAVAYLGLRLAYGSRKPGEKWTKNWLLWVVSWFSLAIFILMGLLMSAIQS